MRDEDKTKSQLIQELQRLRHRVSQLEPLKQDNKQLEQQLQQRNAKINGLVKEQKEAEQTLKETLLKIEQIKHEWEATADSLPELICLLNQDLKIIRTNRAVEHWCYQQVSNVPGMTVGKLLHPNQSRSYLQDFLSEARLVVEQGQRAELDIDDKILSRCLYIQLQPIASHNQKYIQTENTFAVLVIRDITSRKQTEMALQDKEIRLRSVVNNAVDGIITIDDHGIIESFNPAAEQIFGYTAPEVIGQSIKELMPEPDRSLHDQYLKNYLQTGQGNIMGNGREVTAVRKDGTTFPLDLGLSEFYIEEKRLFMGIVRDITERKQLEAQFHQAQKMEVIGRLAGGVAHDFNNILTVVSAHAEFLLMVHPDPEDPAHRDVTQIKKAFERATILTRQLLAFSRKQPVQLQPLNLNMVIENFQKMLHRLIGETIILKSNLAPRLRLIKGDLGQIEQVLMNLAINARDAMPRGGTLTIKTDMVFIKDTDTTSIMKAGTYISLTVTDTGIGMTEEIRQRIFEPFFTTKQAGKGTGLGLSIITNVIEQSNGYIFVESQPRQGTCFQLYFPQYIQTSPLATVVQQKSQQELHGTETILLVEDDINVRAITRQYLEQYGYTVLETSHPRESIKLYYKHMADISLLLTDVVMPDISGPELAQAFSQHKPQLKVLFMSGYADEMLNEHNLLKSEIVLLEKPFSAETLANKIRDLLDN